MAPQGVSGAGGPSKGSNMGVLHTGYLEKYNPANRHTKKRFVVLTHVGLHWFKVCQCISEYLGHLQVDQKTTYYSKKLSDAGSSRGLSSSSTCTCVPL